MKEKLIPQDIVKDLSKINNSRGTFKVAAYLTAVILLWSGVLVLQENLLAVVLMQFLLGVVYAHGLELQHEALHNNLLKSPGLNRVFGTLFGLPMVVSYTHYRLQHLHHHKYLGTDKDNEIFNYNATSLNKKYSFFLRAMNLSKIPYFIYQYVEFLQGNYTDIFNSDKKRKAVLFDYTLILASVAIAIAMSMYFETLIFVLCWFVPWLVFGELVHFFIEFPEHMGCDQTSSDVLSNTRTYQTNPVLEYIFNYNNYHLEHHLYPGIAAENLSQAHQYIKKKARFVESNYIDAIKSVFIGHKHHHSLSENGNSYD